MVRKALLRFLLSRIKCLSVHVVALQEPQHSQKREGGGAQFEPGEAQGFPGVDTDTLLLPKVQEHPGLCLGDQSFCLER